MIKKQDPSMLHTRLTSHLGANTDESEEMEKNVSYKWKPKESRDGSTNTKQNSL